MHENGLGLKANMEHPATRAWLGLINPELIWAQACITRAGSGHVVRHVADRGAGEESLRRLTLEELRGVAQYTVAGAFRPLKSSPNLAPGWQFTAADDAGLLRAMDILYPGSVVDWHAAQTAAGAVTHYREFTNRQTGMYRITQMLTDEQAGLVVRSGCHVSFCLKRRLWTVAGLEPDVDGGKSLIPCLEPCPIMLEFARKGARIEQGERVTLTLAEDEVETLRVALRQVIAHPYDNLREGDTNRSGNPRRARLLLEKIRQMCGGEEKEPAAAGGGET